MIGGKERLFAAAAMVKKQMPLERLDETEGVDSLLLTFRTEELKTVHTGVTFLDYENISQEKLKRKTVYVTLLLFAWRKDL